MLLLAQQLDDWNWYSFLQTFGLGTLVTAFLVVAGVQLWRQVFLPMLSTWGENKQKRMQQELENWQVREEQDLEQQRVNIEAVTAQKEMFSGIGGILDTNNDTMKQILAQLSTLTKKHDATSKDVETLKHFIQEALETDSLKTSLPALKKAMLVVLRNLQRKKEISETDFDECVSLLQKP